MLCEQLQECKYENLNQKEIYILLVYLVCPDVVRDFASEPENKGSNLFDFCFW